MANLIIYNGANSQEVILAGLCDQTGAMISGATISATLTRSGATLTGSSMTFSPVAGTPGSYLGLLSGFDAPEGGALLQVTGSNGGATFAFSVFVTIASRSL